MEKRQSSGNSSRKTSETMYDPSPDPVPPPIECSTKKACGDSHCSNARRIASAIAYARLLPRFLSLSLSFSLKQRLSKPALQSSLVAPLAPHARQASKSTHESATRADRRLEAETRGSGHFFTTQVSFLPKR